jgi:hypothetical protein
MTNWRDRYLLHGSLLLIGASALVLFYATLKVYEANHARMRPPVVSGHRSSLVAGPDWLARPDTRMQTDPGMLLGHGLPDPLLLSGDTKALAFSSPHKP